MERRLCAILAADIVGYSAQMERDEAGTFARLTDRRQAVFDPGIARHQGRIFKTMGDGILAEFASVVQAVECAIWIQAALADRNRDLPEDQRIQARIGINLGEVIVEGDDRLGEGVNLAARLEGLADPGGICVSEKVAREVEKKLAFGFEPMGERRVKNIAEPVRVYRVRASAGAARAAGGPSARKRRIASAAVACAACVGIAVSAWLWWSGPVAVAPPLLKIAPFAIEGGEGTINERVVAEVTGSLLRVLASSPDLAAAEAHDAALPPHPEETGYRLAVTLTKGSPYFAFDIRLLDGATGTPVWSGRREFAPAAYRDERDRIPARIYSSLLGSRGEILRLEAARACRTGFGPASRYCAHLSGQVAFMEQTTEGWQRAEEAWRAGLKAHPGSRQLQLDLAFLAFRRSQGLPPDQAAQEIAAAWGQVADIRDNGDLTRGEAWLYQYLRAVLLPPMLGDFAEAAAAAEKAHALAPYHPMANADLAVVMANAGQAETAIRWATFAVETEVNAPEWYRMSLAWAYLTAGRLREAQAIYQGLSDPVSPEHALTLIMMGREAEARTMFETLARNDAAAPAELLLAQGLGGRQPRALGPVQEAIEFGLWKLNLGQPRKPVQVVGIDTGVEDIAMLEMAEPADPPAASKPLIKLRRNLGTATTPQAKKLAQSGTGTDVAAAHTPPAVPSLDAKGRRVLRPVTDHLRLAGFALPADYLSRTEAERQKLNPTVRRPLPSRNDTAKPGSAKRRGVGTF